MKFVTRNAAETEALAGRFSASPEAGLVCLLGELGSGKTTFVRGFLRGLGHRGEVPSPTFALVNEYARLTPRVYHMDLYRLDGEKDLAAFDLEEYLSDAEAVSFIEWPEVALSRLSGERLEVRFEHAREGRRLTFTARGARAEGWLSRLSARRRA